MAASSCRNAAARGSGRGAAGPRGSAWQGEGFQHPRGDPSCLTSLWRSHGPRLGTLKPGSGTRRSEPLSTFRHGLQRPAGGRGSRRPRRPLSGQSVGDPNPASRRAGGRGAGEVGRASTGERARAPLRPARPARVSAAFQARPERGQRSRSTSGEGAPGGGREHSARRPRTEPRGRRRCGRRRGGGGGDGAEEESREPRGMTSSEPRARGPPGSARSLGRLAEASRRRPTRAAAPERRARATPASSRRGASPPVASKHP